MITSEKSYFVLAFLLHNPSTATVTEDYYKITLGDNNTVLLTNLS